MDLTIGDIYIYCTDLYSYVRHALYIYIYIGRSASFSHASPARSTSCTQRYGRAHKRARESVK